MIAAETKTKVIESHRVHGKDSGSPEVQVAVLTERIKDLSEHLKVHDHDFSSRRGLTQMVSKRNRLLKYLSGHDHGRYQRLIGRLGLRK